MASVEETRETIFKRVFLAVIWQFMFSLLMLFLIFLNMSQKRFNRVSAEVIAAVNDANMIYSSMYNWKDQRFNV